MKHPVPDLSQIGAIDWARLAAYLDGEGCIRIAGVKGSTPKSRRVLYLDVTISNTDLRLCEWLKARFGGNIHTAKRRGNGWAPCGKWNVSSRAAATILENCLPFFIVKREQADLALAFQRTIVVDRRYGRTGRPIALIESQQQMKEDLQTLKGTSGRRGQFSQTIQ